MITIDKFEFDYVANAVVLKAHSTLDDVYITKVIIGTLKAYNTTNNTLDTTNQNICQVKEFTDQSEVEVEFRIDGKYVTQTDLFFCQVIDNSNTVDIPCSMTGDTWASTYDSFSMDVKGMEYISQLAEKCETPTGLTDFILNRNALDVAADCGDYSTMITRYEELMNNNFTSTSSSTKNCGCYG